MSENTPSIQPPNASPSVLIESVDHEGQGVGRLADGRVVFIEGALTGEVVEYSGKRSKDRFEKGTVTRILKASPFRVTPECEWFGVCGGCSLQHLDEAAQVATKQRVLEDALRHLGNVTPDHWLAPLHGPTWGYRRRARLSVRFVPKKGGILVGFHERKSRYVAYMTSCKILPPPISDLLPALSELVLNLSLKEQLPQIEVAVSDAVSVLVLRIMQPLTAEDEDQIRAFVDRHTTARHPLQIWLQPKGPDSAYPFHPLNAPKLTYRLDEFAVEMPFGPTEFTQVNFGINQSLMRRAMHMLDAQPGERIGDMFCGLGNFSLPIAHSGAQVFGVEGSAALVRRAEESAAHNNLSGNTQFRAADLFKITPEAFAALGSFDKLLIDPPRDGAIELVKALPDAGEPGRPERIVYISCKPATLARDASVLVHIKGYRLVTAGIANMFPHTAHVESIALFERL
jgi:23S rRNA (uracil1939-C5)-methyltransferase